MSEPLEQSIREGLHQAANFEPDSRRALAELRTRRLRNRRRSVRFGGVAMAAFALILFLVIGGTQTDGPLGGPTEQEKAREMALEDPAGGSDGGNGGDGGGGGAAGGSGAYAGSTTGGGDGGGGDGGGDGGDGGSGDVGGGPVPGGGAGIVPNVPPSATKVIKNSSIEIRVEEGSFERQFDRASVLADSLGGFVSSSAVNETEKGESAGTITLRVPSQNFQTARSRLKELGKVVAEDQSGQDVTKEFVDLQARLRHAQVQETFFLRLLDRAEGIGELVQVQGQLSEIQLQMEQIQGQLKYLEDQTSFSTVSVRIFEPGGLLTKPEGGLAKAGERSVDGFQSVVGGMVVSFGWLAPFALVGLIVLMVRRKSLRP